MNTTNHAVEYSDGDTIFEGHLSRPASSERRPCVLVGHAWDGPNARFNAMADALGTLGYLALAVDVYGKGVRGRIDGDNSDLMNPLLEDRARLRKRLLAALDFIKNQPLAMADRVVMIGHCFGGLCALDLARAAPAGLVGAIAVHAPLTAPPVPANHINARVLVLHGWEDPHARPSDVLAFADEMTRAAAPWELHAFGHAKHGFTFPGANVPALGIEYNALAAARSSDAIRTFLREVAPVS